MDTSELVRARYGAFAETGGGPLGLAGFTDIGIVARHRLAPHELEAMARCPGPSFSPPVSRSELAGVTRRVASLKFTAVKPARRRRSPDRSGPTAKAPRHR